MNEPPKIIENKDAVIIPISTEERILPKNSIDLLLVIKLARENEMKITAVCNKALVTKVSSIALALATSGLINAPSMVAIPTKQASLIPWL